MHYLVETKVNGMTVSAGPITAANMEQAANKVKGELVDEVVAVWKLDQTHDGDPIYKTSEELET